MKFAYIYGILRPLLLGVLLGSPVTLILMHFKTFTSVLFGPVDSTETTGEVKNPCSNKSKENVITVLVWSWPTYKQNLCSSLFNIEGCFITADKNFYIKADGVVIQHRLIAKDLSNLPQLQRPPFQKWVWMNFLTPSKTYKLPGIKNLFNVTLNYRQDADIRVPYGSIVAAEGKEDFVLPSKNKLVCWSASKLSDGSKPTQYYKEMIKHINIDGYGKAFWKDYRNENLLNTIASCKFYLSFEHIFHKDFISDSFYTPLSVGTVPVVLGPPRQNYENFIQGDAFIHVDDFASPKELTDYLLLLDKNEEMYLRYFEWRQHFKVKKASFWAEPLCLTCDYLRRHKEYKTVTDLDKWYWG